MQLNLLFTSARHRISKFPAALVLAVAVMLLLSRLGGDWTQSSAVNAAGSQQITLNPTSGPAGTTQVTVQGTDWATTSQVTISWDQPAGTVQTATPISGTDTAADGTFTTTFFVPGSSALGTHTVTASQTVSGGATVPPGTYTFSASFEVTPGPASQLAFSTQPGGGTAGLAWDQQPAVEVRDANGNLITTDNSTQVTLSITAATGDATAALTCNQNPVTASGGRASFAGCQIDKASSNNYTLTATSSPLSNAVSDAFSITAASVDANTSTVSAAPTSVEANGVTTSTVTVTLRDANNNPVSGKTVGLSSSRGNLDTISAPAGATSDANGVVVFTVRSSTAGSSTYTATDVTDAIVITQTATVTYTVGPPTQLVFFTQPGGGTAGQAWAQQPVVEVRDAGGNRVMTDNSTQVTLSITAGTGTTEAVLTCTPNPVTASSGRASFAGCRIDRAGSNYRLTASATGRSNATSNTFTIVVASVDANQSAVTASPTSVEANGTSASTITVTLRDASNNPVSGKSVSLNSSRGATDTISAPSGPSDTSGVVTFTVKSSVAGSSTYTATDTTDGIVITQTATVTYTVGPPTQLVFFTQPGGGAAGQAWAQQPVVEVRDAGGNRVMIDNSTQVTLSITASTGTSGAVLTCTPNPVTASSGRASFAGCQIDRAGSNYKLTASATGRSSATSSPFTIGAGAVSAANSTVTSSPPSVPADGSTTSTVTVTLRDANNNPVSGHNVSLSSSRGATDTISAPSGPSDSSGVVTFQVSSSTATPGGSAGSEFTATDTTQSIAITQKATVKFTAQPVTQMGYITQPGGGTSNVAWPQQPVVELRDTGNAAVQQDPDTGVTETVTVSFTPGTNSEGATLGGATTVAVNWTTGRATFTDLQVDKAGTYQLQAVSSLGSFFVDSNAFVIAPGLAARIVVTSGDNQRGRVATTLPSPLVVTVTDAGGNPVNGRTVNWSIARFPVGATGQDLDPSTGPPDSTRSTLSGDNGQAGQTQVDFELGTVNGDYIVAASSNFNGDADATDPGEQVSFTESATGGPGTLKKLGGDRQNGLTTTVLAERLVVGVVDESTPNNLPVSGVTINFSTDRGNFTNDAGANLGTSVNDTTDANGQASIKLKLGAAGDHQVTANCGLCTVVQQVIFTEHAAAPEKLVLVSGDRQFGIVGRAIKQRFRVSVQALDGTPFNNVPVRFDIIGDPGAVGQDINDASGGAQNSYVTNSDTNGDASALLVLGNAPGNYAVRATCTLCDPISTQDFNAVGLPVYRLRGTVKGVDITNTPLAPTATNPEYPNVRNASVTLNQPAFGLTATGTTDSNGRLVQVAGSVTTDGIEMAGGLDSAADGTLSVAAEGFTDIPDTNVTMSPTGVQTPEPLAVTAVQPGKRIQGRVFRADGVTPLVGAQVTANEVDSGGAALSGARSASNITNSSGAYRVDVPNLSPTGGAGTFWTLTATAAGLGSSQGGGQVTVPCGGPASATCDGDGNPINQNITFPANVTLTGAVRVNDQPQAGALISVTPVGSAPTPGNAVTNASGNFSLVLPRPTAVGSTFSYVFHARVSGVGQLIPRERTVKSDGTCLNQFGETISCTLNWAAGTSTITANFVDPFNNPVNVAAFMTASSSTSLPVGGTVPEPFSTAELANGSTLDVRVVSSDTSIGTGVLSKDYALQVSSPGSSALTIAPSSVVTVPGSKTVTVTVPLFWTIRGRVSAVGAIPLAGASVEATSPVFSGGASTFSDDPATDTVNEAGTYSIRVPQTAGRYVITASKAGFLQGSATVDVSGDTTQDFTMVSVATQNTISGTVGAPAGVAVTVTAVSNDGRTVSVIRGASGPNCTGGQVTPTAYCMTVGTGSWTLFATASNYVQTGTPPTVNTNAGSQGPINLAMTPAQTPPPTVQQCTEASGCTATATFTGGKVSLTVPPNVVGTTTNPITVSLNVTTDAPPSASLKSALQLSSQSIAIDMEVRNSTGSLLTQFSQPLTFQIQGALAGTAVGTGFFNSATNNWVILSNCSGVSNDRTCTTTHLSKFTVLSSSVTAAPTAPVPGGGGGGSSATPPPTGGAQTGSGSFSATSGSTVTADGVTMQVPAGVAGDHSGTVSLSVSPSGTPLPSGTPAPLQAVLGSLTFNLTMRDSQGILMTELSKPVTLTLPLSQGDLDLVGGDASQFALVRYDEATKSWVDAGKVTVSADGKTLIITIEHFSLFALVVHPPAPELTGPADGVLAIGMEPILEWANPGGARQFHVQVIPFNNDGPGINMIIGDEALVRLASYEVTPPRFGVGGYIMLPGMTYTWRVRTSPSSAALSEDDSQWGPFSATRSFRTGPPTSATIRLVHPSGGATESSMTPVLQWADQNNRIFYYEVQLSQDRDFITDPGKATAAVYWELIHGGLTDPLNSYRVKDAYRLEAGKTWYWRVRPRVQGDGVPVDWSETWSFRTP